MPPSPEDENLTFSFVCPSLLTEKMPLLRPCCGVDIWSVSPRISVAPTNSKLRPGGAINVIWKPIKTLLCSRHTALSTLCILPLAVAVFPRFLVENEKLKSPNDRPSSVFVVHDGFVNCKRGLGVLGARRNSTFTKSDKRRRAKKELNKVDVVIH